MDGSISARSLTSEADLPAVLRLLLACEATDRLDEFVSLDELETDLVAPQPGWRRAVALWERDGEAVAIAGVWGADDRSHDDSVYGWYNVLPRERSAANLSAVFAWMVRQAGTMAGPGTDFELGARAEADWRLDVARAAGMPEVRRFDRMKRDLAAPIALAPLPAGYAIRPLAGPEEVPAWVETFNASFVDHYGFVPTTVEERLAELARPNYDPALDFVAVAPDGRLAAYCWCDSREPEGQPVEHWVHLLGTHRDHRRRGLATALLGHALAALEQRGATEARLAVDQESSTGATGLYRRAGFTSYATTLVFRRRLAELAG